MSFDRELWREDGRLSQTVSNAKEQLQTNERALHGMMDKVRV
jgi:structural maintenance of chromosome 3 (chondroitin sulfate proteoglycan 6)